MDYQILTYRTASGEAAAGILVNSSVYNVASQPGLAHCRTVMDILNDWWNTEKLLQEAANSIGAAAAVGLPLADVELLAPIPNPGAIYCCGANYTDHINEMRPMLKNLPPDLTERQLVGDEPWHFVRTVRGSIVGPGTSVPKPHGSQRLDWEIEMAVVIGTTARSVPVENALEHVAGYTIANDLSARDLSTRPEVHEAIPFRTDWTAHKCFDGSLPCGPWITPASQIADPQHLDLKLWVNDKLMQDSNTGQMVYTVAQQIAKLSVNKTLYPGDLILTGTPAGVGAGRGVFLKSGDKVRMAIGGVGELRHSIA
jgi:2-keto-4-pentenoate hydratase/2-oxohepta-3-ene-1,7-dioic acid hydratase in catechol pathway